MRVHIIGVPSAGKTTLGKGLSGLLNVPYHDLDSVAFIDERWTLRPRVQRDAMVARILEEPGFVSEGGFLGWTESLLAAADLIVWLDPPLRILIWRHLRRHWRTPRWLPSLVWFQVRMYVRPAGAGPARDDPGQTREGIETALRPLAHKVIRVAHPVHAADVIEGLGQVPSPN